MRDLLNDYFESGEIKHPEKESDPFWDPVEALHIGTSHLQLKNLGYMLPNELDSKILSSEGAQGQNGVLTVNYTPCAANGIDEPEDDVQCDEPHELVGKECYFRVEIDSAKNLPADLCQDTYVTYCFKHEPNVLYKTDVCSGMNQCPKFGYKKVHHIPCVTDYIIDYIDSGSVSSSTLYNTCLDQLQSVRLPEVEGWQGHRPFQASSDPESCNGSDKACPTIWQQYDKNG